MVLCERPLYIMLKHVLTFVFGIGYLLQFNIYIRTIFIMILPIWG